MPMKLSITFTLSLLVIMLFQTAAYVQTPATSSSIFRITSAGCSHEPYKRTQTGFRVDDDKIPGIVTALHGVADCSEINAIANDGTKLEALETVRVDIDRDVALLWSTEVESLPTGGLNIENTGAVNEDDALYTIGYPVNLDTQLSSKDLSLRRMAELADLIPSDAEMIRYLFKRASPYLGIQVLSIEGHLLPGHSGAPIFNESDQVVGVGNGGLYLGQVGIGWAIPWSQIEWKTVSEQISGRVSTEDVRRLNDLSQNNPTQFSFDGSDQELPIIVEKTACKSAIGLNYETLEDFKTDLLLSAKKSAVEELFGELLRSSTDAGNSSVVEDTIQTTTAGYVRISGSPLYYNHETNLAEVCISVKAYVNSDDKEALKPKQIEGRLVCEHDSPTGEDLETFTQDQATIQAVQNYEPSLRDLDDEQILPLLKEKRFFDDGYNSTTGAYCTNVEGQIIPLEIITLLDSGSPSPTPTPTPTAIPTPATTEQFTPTGKLAIPLQHGFDPRVYITSFDGMGINGDNYNAVTQARQPVWSQNGNSIMINGNIDGIQGLFKLDAIGFKKEVIIKRGSARWPVLSPDGKVIIFSDESLSDLMIRREPDPNGENPEDGILTQLTVPSGRPFQGTHLVWSDDNILVFQGCRVWDENAEGDCGVWITNPVELDPQKIIEGNYAKPMDAKNGYLTYVMVQDDNWEVFIMPLRGPESASVNLSNSSAQDGLPAISPDGKLVAYVSNESGEWAVWTVTVDGNQKTKWFDINPQRGTIEPDIWAGDRMSWAK